jgi:D-serine deaminase-like pyridoxal phosphate-dependent protein
MNTPKPEAIQSLETPVLLLDEGRLSRNLDRMAKHLRDLGVPLRPHVKTAKSIDVIRLALVGQPGGITVSTLKEAEYFFSHGITDILYAVCIAPGKLPHVIDLIRRGAQLTIVLDDQVSARAVAAAAAAAGVTISVLLEIDVDGLRSGIAPESPTLIPVARVLAEYQSVQLKGVMTHAGASYQCRCERELKEMAERERRGAVRAAERLRAEGWSTPVVSVGSTPTALFAQDLSGVSEVRAGVYMFQDLVMAGLGVCSADDIALSVLVSVIGHQADRGWIITDGGWMALSCDRGTASQPTDYGYGFVRTVKGDASQDDLIVVSINQEHGVVGLRRGRDLDLSRYPIGTLLRILPNHACATAAAHDLYRVTSGDQGLVRATWSRTHGWW